MKRYIVVILIAMLIWLNIFTGIYFAKSWIEEKRTSVIEFIDWFKNEEEITKFVGHLNFSVAWSYAFYYDKIDIQIVKCPTYLHYSAIGINIIQKNNYNEIVYALLLLNFIIAVIGLFFERYYPQTEKKKRVTKKC
jgi:hypothetical protein